MEDRQPASRWILPGWGAVGLLAVAVAVPVTYQWWSALPEQIIIAAGAPGSRFFELAEAIEQQIEQDTGIDVVCRPTDGALHNLRLLEQGDADLALYQPGVGLAQASEISFLTNLYPQPLHIVVRTDLERPIETASDLHGNIGIGPLDSADHELGVALVDHLGIAAADITLTPLTFEETRRGLEADRLDGAIMTVGFRTPMLPGVLDSGRFRILGVPHSPSFTRQHLVLNEATLPEGLYYSTPRAVPDRDVPTVSVDAQLLTRRDLPAAVTEVVTAAVHRQRFLLGNRLRQLYSQNGYGYSRRKPSFSIHPGALNFYEPELKPLLDVDFVEATEGLRSLLVSVVIACFILVRWAKRRRGHRLDSYMSRLLVIEREQLDLDQNRGQDDVQALQEKLDEVTRLREDALQAINTYDLSDEPGVDLFLEMSHAISEKISAKLTRQRFEQALANVGSVMEPR